MGASTAIAAPVALSADAPWGGGCPWSSDKTEFKKWCKAAIDYPRGKERKELYGYLAECFLDADGDRDGKVGVDEFDFLIEKAASLPRRFGLAPTWQEEYGDVARRAAARKHMFGGLGQVRDGPHCGESAHHEGHTGFPASGIALAGRLREILRGRSFE